MTTAHNLGFPRLGVRRELKLARRTGQPSFGLLPTCLLIAAPGLRSVQDFPSLRPCPAIGGWRLDHRPHVGGGAIGARHLTAVGQRL